MKKYDYFSLIILLAIGSGIYANTLDNQFLWDDDDFFVRNAYTKDWKHLKNIFTENVIAGSGLVSNYYRPVLLMTFLIDYSLWGLNPIGYHAVNMLLHVMVSFLVYFILKRIIKKWKISLLFAVIYLVHPIHTEAVAYTSGRGDPIAAFFMLTSLFAFNKSNETTDKFRKIAYISVSLFLLLLGLMTREVLIYFPFLLALWILCFPRKKLNLDTLKRLCIRISPYVILTFLYILIRLTLLNFSNILNFYGSQNFLTENIWYRFLTFLSILPEFYKLIIFPVYLNFERNHPVHTTIFNATIVLSVVVLIVFSYIMYRSFKKDRIVFFGLSWFFITLFPVSNILVPINGLIYEHWLYVPLIGIIIIFAYLAKKLVFGRLFRFRYVKAAFFILVVVFILFFSARTYIRNDDWQDALTFYEKTIEDSPNSVRLHNNLAMGYAGKGDHGLAIMHYKKAIELDDSFAQPYYNLGNLYLEIGNYQNAADYYEQAIKTNPNFLFTYPKLISLYNDLEKEKDVERISKLFKSKISMR